MIKNRKNILTYLVAALAILLASASWSPAASALPLPQNYSGMLTHGEFISWYRSGPGIPPAYLVDGTWVLHIDRLAQGQVPPPAQLTMIVFRDGKHYLQFPNIDLTPVSVAGGVYTYSFGPQVTVTLDTNMTPAMFSWHVEFADNCTLRTYRSLSYIGVAY